MDSLGYYGDLPGAPHARIRPYSQATGLGVVTPTDVRRPVVIPQFSQRRGGRSKPIKSGAYVGAPGRRVTPRMNSMQQDAAFLHGLGMTLAGSGDAAIREHLQMRGLGGLRGGGLGAVDERAVCSTIASLITTIGGTIGSAAIGSAPTRNPGESTADFQRRQSAYQELQRTFGGSMVAAQQAANFCNLIDRAESQSTVDNTAQIEAYRAQLALLAQRQGGGGGMSTGTKVAIGAGAIGAVGLIAFLLI